MLVDLHDAHKKKAMGFTAYKIKVGIDTPEKDAARTRAICNVGQWNAYFR